MGGVETHKIITGSYSDENRDTGNHIEEALGKTINCNEVRYLGRDSSLQNQGFLAATWHFAHQYLNKQTILVFIVMQIWHIHQFRYDMI